MLEDSGGDGYHEQRARLLRLSLQAIGWAIHPSKRQVHEAMLFYTIGLAIQRFQRQVRRASSTSLPCNSFLFEFHVMTNLSSQSNHASSVFHMSRKRPAHTIKMVAILVR